MSAGSTDHAADRAVAGEDALRLRLEWAEATLRAIRSGEVDALVMTTAEGDRVFTLLGADEPYRIMLERMSEGVATLSPERIVLYANTRLAEMLDVPLPALVGSPIERFMATEHHPALASLFEGRAPGSRRSGELALTGDDGRRIEAHLSITPLPESTGAAWCMIATDVTERAQHLAAIVEASADAIIGLNAEGLIESWNAGAERLYGYSAGEAVGRHAPTLLAADATEREPLLRRVIESAIAVQIESHDVHKDGSLIDVAVTDSPIRDIEGRVIGIARTARDVTDRNRVERARARALADLEEAQQLARLGSWTWNPSTDTCSWSAQMYEIYGRDRSLGAPSVEQLIAYAHPDDRQRLRDVLAMRFGRESAFAHEHRISTGDGALRTVRTIGQADPTRPGCYRGTVQDVTEERQAERERIELREANARAESANRAKSEFLARMSHELRTPLNSIVGFSQLVELDGLEPRQREHIGFVIKAADHLLAMIDEVLELARIEVGKMTVSPEPVALADTIRDVLAFVGPVARDRGVKLHADSAWLAGDEHVQADRHRLKQVLLNVLSNAIKYNRPGGRVDISFETTDDGRVRTTIADTGIGIQPGQLPKLFEPFERLGAEFTQIEGTGLGLALSKRLLDAMDGTIEVQSTPGSRTAFTIELAGASPPDAGQQPTTRVADLIELGGREGRGSLIVYIEDNLSNLTLVERILQRFSGVELIPAMQATIGLELAREHRPDLIILDLHLPDMPGVEVLKRLKADESTRQIPVVVLTADATKGQSERVRGLGAGDYLTKPLDVSRFLRVIAANLARP